MLVFKVLDLSSVQTSAQSLRSDGKGLLSCASLAMEYLPVPNFVFL